MHGAGAFDHVRSRNSTGKGLDASLNGLDSTESIKAIDFWILLRRFMLGSLPCTRGQEKHHDIHLIPVGEDISTIEIPSC